MKKILEELKPLWKSSKELILENQYLNPITNLQKHLIQHKLEEFARNIEEKTEQRREDFLNELKEEEIPFFLESVRKVMNFDDSLQIFINTHLLLKFKENKKLNYQEKSLYYNIQQLTEDDFKVYYCYYKNFLVNSNNYKTDDGTIFDPELIESVLNKFKLFFILKDVNTDEAFFYKEPKNIQVETTNYSEELFLLLDEYFKKKNRSGCDDYIKENFN